MGVNAGLKPRQLLRFPFPWLSLFLCVPPLLSGCAPLAPSPKDTVVKTILIEPVTDAAHLRSPNFLLAGRVAVTGGKESFSSGVRWHHSEAEDEIILLSPLGQTLAQIQLGQDGAYLTTSEQQGYYAPDVESLTEQVLGWHLPVAGLQYWVQAISSPVTAAEVDVDENGRVVAIRQDGWAIDYLGYFPTRASSAAPLDTEERLPPPISQPRLLRLKRGELQIKLVVDAWNPAAAGGV